MINAVLLLCIISYYISLLKTTQFELRLLKTDTHLSRLLSIKMLSLYRHLSISQKNLYLIEISGNESISFLGIVVHSVVNISL